SLQYSLGFFRPFEVGAMVATASISDALGKKNTWSGIFWVAAIWCLEQSASGVSRYLDFSTWGDN
ncbi:TPA: hypothetical protein ACNU2I_004260, partial [Aeromonas salmonicida subsp. salmonicida]